MEKPVPLFLFAVLQGVGDWVKEFESKASGALLQNLNANNEVSNTAPGQE